MKLNRLIYSILILGFMALVSCEEVFETDITNKNLILLIPGDSVVSKNLNQQFQWEMLQGAREYRVQISSPTFQQPKDYYLDTVVQKNSFNIALQPGHYQWRVQGLNAGYATSFITRSFTIDSTATLTNQVFTLLNPVQGFITNNPTIDFKWENVQNADKYLFQLLTTPVFDTIVYKNELKRRLPNTSQSYSWKVTALNSLSLKNSPTFQFTVDVTNPGLPELRFPSVDTSFLFLPVKFSWNRKASDIQYDSLIIFDNQLRTISGFPKRVNGTSFTLSSSNTTLMPGVYYWAIRSIDQAGNASPRTSRRRFVKQ